MGPIADIDVLILLATALASKRRPATLLEIVAAADLVQGMVPYPEKLGEAIRRLSVQGLVGAAEGGLTLTPRGEEIVAGPARKADMTERLAAAAAKLSGYVPKGECAPVLLTREELGAAVQAHKAARRTPGKNLLLPKAKPDRHFKVEGRWRRASGTRGRKA